MPKKLKDIRGNRYGTLEVKEFLGLYGTQAVFLCYCHPGLGGCGKQETFTAEELVQNGVRSCGCIRTKSTSAGFGKPSHDFADEVKAIIDELLGLGNNWVQIATHLNSLGYRTTQNKMWSGPSVASWVKRNYA